MIKAIILTFLVFFSQVALVAPQALPRLQTYDELLGAIRQTRAASAERIEVAIEQEKVREAWETGKLIDEHVLQHKERAAYGEQVIIRLAQDLGTSETELKYMLQFARTYPIRLPADKLSWSHYQALLSLNDPKEREEVTKEAVKRGWNRDRLREEVRRRLARDLPLPQSELPEAKPGTLHTYRVVRDWVGEDKDELVIDLGFSNYLSVRDVQISTDGTSATGQKYTGASLKDGDIVELIKGELKKSEFLKERDLYTFQAEVIRVLDGDTFAASVDLGFGFTTIQTLRLRGLDAPEIQSAEGKEAKAFVESEFAKARGKILIKTVKSDKYDRYLADVWVGDEYSSARNLKVSADSTWPTKAKYLNQKLLDRGLATRVSE